LLPTSLALNVAERLLRLQDLPLDRFGPIEVAQTVELLDRYATNRNELRSILNDHPTGPMLPTAMGPLLDIEFLDAAEVAADMESLAFTAALKSSQSTQAEDAITTTLQLAAWLADEPHLTTRIVAAQIRQRAFVMLQRMIESPSMADASIVKIARLIDLQIATWPPDSLVWQGERMQGLLTYEIVRSGHYFSLLPADEVEELKDQGILQTTGRAILRSVDADQQFYLRAMRQMIEATSQPYFLRINRLRTLAAELHTLQGDPAEPVIASQMLLVDFEAAHRWQALDRSRMEAWHLALGLAEGLNLSPSESPLTGELYKIQQLSDKVVVSGIAEPDEPIKVRRLTVTQPTSIPGSPSALGGRPAAEASSPAIPETLPASAPSARESRSWSRDVFPKQSR
jgi:hypothetical protein